VLNGFGHVVQTFAKGVSTKDISAYKATSWCVTDRSETVLEFLVLPYGELTLVSLEREQ
jgi:hypothetical protein